MAGDGGLGAELVVLGRYRGSRIARNSSFNYGTQSAYGQETS